MLSPEALLEEAAGVDVVLTLSLEELLEAAAVLLLEEAAAVLDVLDVLEALDEEELLADVDVVLDDPQPARSVATIAALINVATTLRFMFFLL
ncbi:MAG: hypothetical protein ACI4ET_09515 [Bilifractor sp.]